ncbi:MAG: CHAT domain-containing protein [Abditibacteriales bacterium]|nr:CHAT domain-containing protein [Abditibacteriales bacterium]MDW8364345.1 CHAT domain-containing protein [Abditibacteriales bacterium]
MRGYIYKDVLSDHPQALVEFQRMLAVAQRSDNRESIALAYNNIGGTLVWLGKAPEGISKLETAVRMLDECCAQQPDNQRARRCYLVVLNHLAAKYLALGLSSQAWERYTKSLTLSRRVNDKVGEAGALWGMGNVHRLRRQYAEAEQCFKQSLAVTNALKPKPHWGWVVSNLSSLWDIYCKQGKYPEALQYAQDMLKVGQRIGHWQWEVSALDFIARVYIRQGDHARACQSIEKALQKIGVATSLTRSSLSYALRGDLYRLKGQWERAAAAYQQAITEREKYLLWAPDPLAPCVLNTDPYRSLAVCQIKLNRPAAALRTAERTKARLLTEFLQAGRIDITKAMTAEERQMERQLDERIRAANTQLTSLLSQPHPDPQLVKTLKARLATAREEFDSFRLQLYLKYPELKAQRAEMKPITLDQIAQLLPDHHTAFLEYLIGDDHSYLFVLTRQPNGKSAVAIAVYPLAAKRDLLSQMVSEFRADIMSHRKVLSQAQRLYQLLVAPAEEALKGKTMLGIIPDDALWDLPFQALQDKVGRYLVEKHALFYAPSLTALDTMNRLLTHRRIQPPNHPTPQPPVLLAMAHPVFDATRKLELTLRGVDHLADLPNTEKEVRGIQASFGKAAKVYVRHEATEERAKQEINRYRILHFATHGVFDPNQPMYSGILLTRQKGQEDGYLEAREIASMTLNADLVVLSACDTARGVVQEGEGIIGLSWALFIAGCPSSLLTQWKVADDSTAELMKQFYAHLKRGQSKAAALQAAQLTLLRSGPRSNPKWRLPFYWAPFVLIGDGRPPARL